MTKGDFAREPVEKIDSYIGGKASLYWMFRKSGNDQKTKKESRTGIQDEGGVGDEENSRQLFHILLPKSDRPSFSLIIQDCTKYKASDWEVGPAQ